MSKLNKRIMSAVLAFILFMTNIPVVGSADNSTFAITYEGETVKKVEFYNHEKITVCAENIPEGSHQWQIKIPGTEQWVNIHGQTDAEIGLSYAVVGSLLVDDSAYVRCAAISEGLEIAHTATLRVTVKEEPVRQEPVYVAPVIEATEAPAEETEAPIEETEAPIEETEAPIEETEAPIEETEAPVEETEAPVEETEAPVEETEAPVEETEAPVEETEAPVEETEAPIEETEAPVEATETPAEPVAEVPAAPAEEEPAAPVAETEAATEETEEATEATEAPKKTTKKSSKKTATKSVTNQKTDPVTPKAAGTDVEIVTVTVHYRAVDRYNKFETTREDATVEANAANAEPVTDSYVARIVKGSDLSVTIPCHVMPGYTLEVPQYHKDDPITVSGNNLVLNLDDVAEDTTFYAYYKEAMVPYTARYFMQNVYNDLYTEDTNILTTDTQNQMVGYPGEEPNPRIIYPNVTGFTALFFQPDTIAADGSTVFEVYYDRNYYLMNFDMDGGYGTAPVYARYGTAFTVADPTKSGWSFVDWELELVEGEPATEAQKELSFPTAIPAENRTYKAIWDHSTTTYTVVYWAEKANPESDGSYDYSYWGSKTISADSGTEVTAVDYSTDISGLIDSEYFTYNSELTETEEGKNPDYDPEKGKVIVNGDGSTILNVYYDRKDYFIKFYYLKEDSNGKQYVATNTGGASNANGKYFNADWSGSTSDVKLTLPTDNADKYDDEQFDTNGGNKYYYFVLKAKYGETIMELWPAAPLTAKDYTFVSWSTQYGTKYNENNTNKNIKGPYARMDSEIIKDPNGEIDPAYDAIEAQFMVGYWNTSGSLRNWTYYIYLEALKDSDQNYIIPEGKQQDEIDTDGDGSKETYILENKLENIYSYWENPVGQQTLIPYDGYKFVKRHQKSWNNASSYVAEVNFYYQRNVHKLNFWNYDGNLDSGDGVTLAYGAPLKKYGDYADADYMHGIGDDPYTGSPNVSHYPATLEPDAYYFDGWYTTAECLPGTEMDWNSTMPDADITVYANWEPIKYTTYFYMDYDRYNSDEWYDKIEGTPHGEKMVLGEFNPKPTFVEADSNTKNYIFVGWFYIDGDGTKKAFNPAEMAVRKELHLFAEWTTTTVKEYTVSYQYGVEDPVTGEYGPADDPAFTMAKDSEGYALEATTKTFNALPKDKLTSFPDGKEDQLWLPHTNSHSIVMRSENSENVFTFYYITKDVAPYEVRYLDAATHEPLLKEGENEIKGGKADNQDAVVTETFRYIPGYIPDAFHKQLILSANDAENVIIFYYTKDSEVDDGDVGGDDPGEGRARYLVVHHYPELDGSDYRVEEDKIGNIGETGIGTEQERAGFEFDEAETRTNNPGKTVEQAAGKWTVSGIVTSGEDDDANKPLELHLYYNRLNYGYRIIHKDRETGTTIEEERVGLDTGKESEKVPFESVVSATATGIQGYDLYDAETDGTKTLTLKISWDDKMNVITFEYIRKKLTIEYIPVCTDDTMTGFGGVSNPLDYDKATPTGSQAYAASGFQFLGWYSDEDCETKVAEAERFQPNVTTVDGIYDYTFYALFEPIDYTVTYDANGGAEVPSETSHVGKIITLPATTKDGYTLLGWWYDADDDGTIDEGEEYAAGSEFTMPAKNVDFTAQWIDSRIDDSHNVLVGINMSFYKDGDSLYYSFPAGEPTVVNLEAARAYIATEDEDGNTWMIRTEGTWNRPLPGKFEDYIDPTILTKGDLEKNGDVIGVYDESGVKTKKYLRLTDADYLGIVQAWLYAQDYLSTQFPSANIDWDSLPSDPKEYEVIPYVVKRHWHQVAQNTDWFIDVIIVPKAKYKITYELNLKGGYVDTAPQDNNEYGQGFIANVAEFHDVARTDNPDYIAKFLGWHYDVNGNGAVDDGEVYAGGSKITIPAENVVLTALWSYRMDLTIQTTGPDEGQHYIFNVSGTAKDGTNVNLTVSLGAKDEKKIVDLPEGDYTVTEQSDWRWKYGMPAITKTPTTETPTHWKFDYNSTEVDWLGGEGYNPNKFDAVT